MTRNLKHCTGKMSELSVKQGGTYSYQRSVESYIPDGSGHCSSYQNLTETRDLGTQVKDLHLSRLRHGRFVALRHAYVVKRPDDTRTCNWKGCGRRQLWPTLKYFFGICPVGQENHENFLWDT
jgi:hypothetical protein